MKVHLPGSQCTCILYAKEFRVMAIKPYVTLQHVPQSYLPSDQHHSTCGPPVTIHKRSHFRNVINDRNVILVLFEDRKTVKKKSILH